MHNNFANAKGEVICKCKNDKPWYVKFTSPV